MRLHFKEGSFPIGYLVNKWNLGLTQLIGDFTRVGAIPGPSAADIHMAIHVIFHHSGITQYLLVNLSGAGTVDLRGGTQLPS